MGNFTKNLYKKGRTRPSGSRIKPPLLGSRPAYVPPKGCERLVCAAIVRDGKTYGGERSHAQIRAAMGDEDPYVSRSGDQEGFLTTTQRFVTRREAAVVGVISGQLTEHWKVPKRPLLSSDISW